jgi:hypothetical protein
VLELITLSKFIVCELAKPAFEAFAKIQITIRNLMHHANNHKLNRDRDDTVLRHNLDFRQLVWKLEVHRLLIVFWVAFDWFDVRLQPARPDARYGLLTSTSSVSNNKNIKFKHETSLQSDFWNIRRAKLDLSTFRAVEIRWQCELQTPNVN